MKKLSEFLGVLFKLMCVFFCIQSVHAQNLTQESTWQLTGEKKNFYANQGVFHYNLKAITSKLSNPNIPESTINDVRTRYDKSKKTLRLVFDLSSAEMAPLYGHISAEKKKVFIDFFHTTPREGLNQTISTPFLESLKIWKIEKNMTSVELQFNEKYLFEVFTLSNPARLVIDIKK